MAGRLIRIFLFNSILLTITLSHIIVRSPDALVQQFKGQSIKAGLSNFGRIPYGHNLVGRLYYSVNEKDPEMACKKITSIEIPSENHVDESPIVIVPKGSSCTYVTMVRNIENLGGHVALIINNVDNEDVENIIMADDGRGRDISIPGLIISKEDGKKLTDYYTELAQNPRSLRQIVLEIDFDLENSKNTVDYDIYFTSDSEAVYSLLEDLEYYDRQLNGKARLNVHYVTYQHSDYDSTNPKRNSPKANCLGNGKFCNNPGKFGVTDGAEVVKENIKQKCVYKYSYETVNNTSLYWNYMNMFYTKCLDIPKPTFTSACSALATKEAQLPVDEINKCIYASYTASEEEKKQLNFEKTSGNSILDMDNEERKSNYLSKIPSITINDRVFFGSWRGDNIFEALCASLKKKPEVCYIEGGFERPIKYSKIKIALIVLFIVLINVLIFIFCRKYIKKKIADRIDETNINHKIDTVVTSYLSLRDRK